MTKFFQDSEPPSDYIGLFKCVRCCNITFSCSLICVALGAVATPTSPRKRTISSSSLMVLLLSRTARTARSQ